MKKLLFFVFLGLSTTSCLKEERPIKKLNSQVEGSEIVTMTMGTDYKSQVFFSLDNFEVVKKTDRESWDLRFETTPDGYHVLLNSGRMGGVKLLSTNDFSSYTHDNTNVWKYDAPSGNLDSTAIGDWRTTDNIYLYFLGNKTDGTSMGKYKFRILSVDANGYTMEYCKLGETTPQTVTIPKRPDYNFSTFSFVQGIENTEASLPKKTDFDICLRSYTHIYTTEFGGQYNGMPYNVVGCMLNDYKTIASVAITDKSFKDVSYADALSAEYGSQENRIGFGWKNYNFDTAEYEMHPEYIYIVKTQNGRYFKLHFLDYYDSLGEKGSPKMEVMELVP